MTNVEYHECIPMFNKDSKSGSDFERKHMDVKEHAKGKEIECMEHPLNSFSNNPDIDTDDIKPKGQNGVTVVLYQTPTEPYFMLSTTRDTKVSNNLKLISSITYCYSIKISFTFLKYIISVKTLTLDVNSYCFVYFRTHNLIPLDVRTMIKTKENVPTLKLI